MEKRTNACAMENIFLAAHSLGIGSVWINQLQGICDEPSIREILNDFGIPADHIVYGMAALGYADDVKAEKKADRKSSCSGIDRYFLYFDILRKTF